MVAAAVAAGALGGWLALGFLAAVTVGRLIRQDHGDTPPPALYVVPDLNEALR